MNIEKTPHYFCFSCSKNNSFAVACNYGGIPLFKRAFENNSIKVFKEEMEYIFEKYGNVVLYSMPVNIFGVPLEEDFIKEYNE